MTTTKNTTTKNTTTKPVLVLGSTGKTGSRVAAQLRQRGHEVRGASRKGPVTFDWNDENTWEQVLEGAGAAYLVDSQLPGAAESMRSFGKLAVACGVERLVLLSARDWVVPQGEEKLPCERAVRESGARWTILKPSWFFQNFSEDPFIAGQVQGGEIVMSAGGGVEPFIDADDIAEVAVAALTEEGHGGQSYELSGPRLLSLDDVADEIARATGRAIAYRPLPPDEFTAHAVRQGVPEEFAGLLNMLYGWIAENRFATVADGVQRVLGREPRDFGDYARTVAASGVWGGGGGVERR
ncbi:NAD(P)H-binding protein [Streptomyces spororaveus]|uniref:NmrA family NAD(P)-binding protein n=1 Tax=Streptomyces spororaveus TaxID=284039 RepID=UPI001922ADD2|nr:NAD(P)H-binding protein [Streptomyces spororaveus]MCM9081136.1 NAD(P)H-binding protein [Streptomyces spororaveus]